MSAAHITHLPAGSTGLQRRPQANAVDRKPPRTKKTGAKLPVMPDGRAKGAFSWDGELAQFIVEDLAGRPEFRVEEVPGGVIVFYSNTNARVYMREILAFRLGLELGRSETP